MRDNTGGFNAPSREAIYYRIHKLAYGDEWEYDYEKFVEWDAKNRQTQSDVLRMPTRKETQNFVPLHPPVIKQMTWREALDRKQTPQRNLIKAKEGLPVYDKSINHLQNTNKYVVTTDSYDEL
jgi:asparagine synthetase B (glutamine-hydrolysing)